MDSIPIMWQRVFTVPESMLLLIYKGYYLVTILVL